MIMDIIMTLQIITSVHHTLAVKNWENWNLYVLYHAFILSIPTKAVCVCTDYYTFSPCQ